MQPVKRDVLANVDLIQFAIRPSIRNNKEFTRDGVIKTVAAAVGPGHKVDLHGYDFLILVEIYKVDIFHSTLVYTCSYKTEHGRHECRWPRFREAEAIQY